MNMQKRITILKQGVGKTPNLNARCCPGTSVAKIK